MSIPITYAQRQTAHRKIDNVKADLVFITENVRNVDHEARQAIYRAMDAISEAETIIANQREINEQASSTEGR